MKLERPPKKSEHTRATNTKVSARRDRRERFASTPTLNIPKNIKNSRATTLSDESSLTKASSLSLLSEMPFASTPISSFHENADADLKPGSVGPLPPPPSPTNYDENGKGLARDKTVVLHVPEEESHECWDFQLPRLKAPHMPLGQVDAREQGFHVHTLTRSLQHGTTAEEVEDYLRKCTSSAGDEEQVKCHMQYAIEGVFPMFYAVATKDERIVRAIARYDGNVNQTIGIKCSYQDQIPLLAFAVISSTDSIVAVLLGLGAKASVFPKVFYDPYLKDLGAEGPCRAEIDDFSENDKLWCRPISTRKRLSKALDLTRRYHLHRSTVIQSPPDRGRMVTSSHNAQSLWEIPYLVIGQMPAVTLLTDRLVTQLVLGAGKPLVLVFAGPSGHGKTELARSLRNLLQIAQHNVDCTTETYVSDIFGTKPGLDGSAQGSPLNNFLVENDNKRAIIFLDEFEKTRREVQDAFLIPFEKGEYNERRYRQQPRTINCSQFIWIIATNAIDQDIKWFWEENKASLQQASANVNQHKILFNSLKKIMTSRLKIELGSPLTSRVDEIIPFLPFDEGEQAVGAHKYILQLMKDFCPLENNPKSAARANIKGNILRESGVRLHVRDDVSVCKHLALENYDKDLGMRSLQNAVNRHVKVKLAKAWWNSSEPTTTTTTTTRFAEKEEEENYILQMEGGDIEVRRQV